MHNIDIFIDDREPREMQEVLSKIPGVQIRKQRLSCGDYLINNWLIIERKQLNDLVISIIDGRLFSQAKKLADSCYTPLIVIEGQTRELSSFNVDRRAVLGALAAVSLKFGVTILRTQCQRETANLMLYSAQQCCRKRNEANPRFGYRPKTLRGKQLYLLQGIPQIGKKLAVTLLQHFGSPEAVFNASELALSKVEGIGQKTAALIRQVITAK